MVGVGIMMFLVNVLVICYVEFKKKGMIMGIIGLVFNFLLIIGLIVLGLILDDLFWCWFFLVIVFFFVFILVVVVI